MALVTIRVWTGSSCSNRMVLACSRLWPHF